MTRVMPLGLQKHTILKIFNKLNPDAEPGQGCLSVCPYLVLKWRGFYSQRNPGGQARKERQDRQGDWGSAVHVGENGGVPQKKH